MTTDIIINLAINFYFVSNSFLAGYYIRASQDNGWLNNKDTAAAVMVGCLICLIGLPAMIIYSFVIVFGIALEKLDKMWNVRFLFKYFILNGYHDCSLDHLRKANNVKSKNASLQYCIKLLNKRNKYNPTGGFVEK